MSRILIIEDEEAIAELEKDYLELSGFEVIICNRGDLGLNMALKEDFDLIILDLMLPGVDGFEICRQIRDQKNTPIIMVECKIHNQVGELVAIVKMYHNPNEKVIEMTL